MVRAAFETKETFVSRVMRSKGFGTMTVQAAPRPPVKERSRDEILAEQAEREEAYFGKAYRFGPVSRWRVEA
jgi:hypothetical protein